MKLKLNKIVGFLFTFLLFINLEASAELFELYTGEVVGAYRDLTVTKVDDTYFLHKEDLLPGDTISGEYIIKNTSSRSYNLSLKSIIDENSPISFITEKNGEEVKSDWIKDIKLKLILDGEIIYDGSATGNDNFKDTKFSDSTKTFSKDGIRIGKILKNSERVLKAEFSIPEELTNEYQEAWARVDWIFEARWTTPSSPDNPPDDPDIPSTDPDDPKDPGDNNGGKTEDENPLPAAGEIPDEPLPAAAEILDEPFETPDTGDSVVNIIIYVIIILGALSGIILVVLSNKKKKEE